MEGNGDPPVEEPALHGPGDLLRWRGGRGHFVPPGHVTPPPRLPPLGAGEGVAQVLVVGEGVLVRVHDQVPSVEPGPEAPLGVLPHPGEAHVVPPEVPVLHGGGLPGAEDPQVEGHHLLLRLPRGILSREDELVLEGPLGRSARVHPEGQGGARAGGGQGVALGGVGHPGVAARVPAGAVGGPLGAGVGEAHGEGHGGHPGVVEDHPHRDLDLAPGGHGLEGGREVQGPREGGRLKAGEVTAGREEEGGQGEEELGLSHLGGF
jgi:hypothetical protein